MDDWGRRPRYSAPVPSTTRRPHCRVGMCQRLRWTQSRPLHAHAVQRSDPRHQRPAAPAEHCAASLRRLACVHRPAQHHQPVRGGRPRQLPRRYGNQFPGHTNLGFGELSLRDTPTLSYHPREGREIAKALLTPLSADLLIVVNAGANLEQLLLFSINDINDVPNAPGATTLIPRVPDDNARVPSGASGYWRRCGRGTPPSWRSGRTRRPRTPRTRSPGARSAGATF